MPDVAAAEIWLCPTTAAVALPPGASLGGGSSGTIGVPPPLMLFGPWLARICTCAMISDPNCSMPWISGSLGLTFWSVWKVDSVARTAGVADHRAVVLHLLPKHVGAGIGFHISRFDGIGRDPHRYAVWDRAGI